MLVEPRLLFHCQETGVNQILAVWDHSDVLEAQVGLVAKRMLCLDFGYHCDILDPNAI